MDNWPVDNWPADNWSADNWPVTFWGVGQLAGDFLKVVLEFVFFNFINSSKCFTSTVIGIQGKTRL